MKNVTVYLVTGLVTYKNVKGSIFSKNMFLVFRTEKQKEYFLKNLLNLGRLTNKELKKVLGNLYNVGDKCIKIENVSSMELNAIENSETEEIIFKDNKVKNIKFF